MSPFYFAGLKNKELLALAGQLTDWIGLLAHQTKCTPNSAELTDSFPVWILQQAAVERDGTNLGTLSEFTDRWHSQVYIDGKPKYFVRSLAIGADQQKLSIVQIWDGELAVDIDLAMNLLRAQVSAQPNIRLLEVPAHHTATLWLVNDDADEIIVARAPKSFTNLVPLARMSAIDFLHEIRKLDPVNGYQSNRHP